MNAISRNSQGPKISAGTVHKAAARAKNQQPHSMKAAASKVSPETNNEVRETRSRHEAGGVGVNRNVLCVGTAMW